MQTLVPTSTDAISATYAEDLTAAIVAATALAAVLLITYLVIRATFTVLRLFIVRQVIADTIAVGILVTAVLIGLLNR
ncbi:hypothetical protein ACTI_83650 [Actinoplanes sp. OR16]|uniref:hypothetical protein n=1 Tax=Actinoplanes sp. OR16 TaxID=946334 RepID=UPI000F6C7D38|nr:hypothetical protein [Actinoplanes sp. OR16]BBH71680.1 hypothetical protein ACTI_83650 [Actinoplanes sp. OR16]